MITGRDGQIRGAILRVASEKGRSTTLQRPLQRLYPLEIECYIKEPEGEDPHNSRSHRAGILEPVDTTLLTIMVEIVMSQSSILKERLQHKRNKIMAWITHESEDD